MRRFAFSVKKHISVSLVENSQVSHKPVKTGEKWGGVPSGVGPEFGLWKCQPEFLIFWLDGDQLRPNVKSAVETVRVIARKEKR